LSGISLLHESRFRLRSHRSFLAYQQLYSVQIIHLQFENQFFAQRVALEQAVGSPLPN
jgi:hypothetical protein